MEGGFPAHPPEVEAVRLVHIQAAGSDSIAEYLGLLAFGQRDLLNAAGTV